MIWFTTSRITGVQRLERATQKLCGWQTAASEHQPGTELQSAPHVCAGTIQASGGGTGVFRV